MKIVVVEEGLMLLETIVERIDYDLEDGEVLDDKLGEQHEVAPRHVLDFGDKSELVDATVSADDVANFGPGV